MNRFYTVVCVIVMLGMTACTKVQNTAPTLTVSPKPTPTSIVLPTLEPTVNPDVRYESLESVTIDEFKKRYGPVTNRIGVEKLITNKEGHASFLVVIAGGYPTPSSSQEFKIAITSDSTIDYNGIFPVDRGLGASTLTERGLIAYTYPEKNKASGKDNTILCFMPRTSNPGLRISQVKTYDDLVTDFQSQQFTGQVIPLCWLDQMLLSDEGIGYVIPYGVFIDHMSVRNQFSPTPVKGYLYAEDESVYLSSTPRNQEHDQQIVTIMTQYLKTLNSPDKQAIQGPEDACSLASAYFLNRSSNDVTPLPFEDYQTLCGPVSIFAEIGIGGLRDPDNSNYIYIMSDVALTKPIGTIDGQDGITLSRSECDYWEETTDPQTGETKATHQQIPCKPGDVVIHWQNGYAYNTSGQSESEQVSDSQYIARIKKEYLTPNYCEIGCGWQYRLDNTVIPPETVTFSLK